MTDSIDELHAAAALAELIYARDSSDQSITTQDIFRLTGVELGADPINRESGSE